MRSIATCDVFSNMKLNMLLRYMKSMRFTIYKLHKYVLTSFWIFYYCYNVYNKSIELHKPKQQCYEGYHVYWHNNCKGLDKFFNNVNEMLVLIHFDNYKECLCLGDEVVVRHCSVSPLVLAQMVLMLGWWNNGYKLLCQSNRRKTIIYNQLFVIVIVANDNFNYKWLVANNKFFFQWYLFVLVKVVFVLTTTSTLKEC
jgi:hypothetical protein